MCEAGKTQPHPTHLLTRHHIEPWQDAKLADDQRLQKVSKKSIVFFFPESDSSIKSERNQFELAKQKKKNQFKPTI